MDLRAPSVTLPGTSHRYSSRRPEPIQPQVLQYPSMSLPFMASQRVPFWFFSSLLNPGTLSFRLALPFLFQVVYGSIEHIPSLADYCLED